MSKSNGKGKFKRNVTSSKLEDNGVSLSIVSEEQVGDYDYGLFDKDQVIIENRLTSKLNTEEKRMIADKVVDFSKKKGNEHFTLALVEDEFSENLASVVNKSRDSAKLDLPHVTLTEVRSAVKNSHKTIEQRVLENNQKRQNSRDEDMIYLCLRYAEVASKLRRHPTYHDLDRENNGLTRARITRTFRGIGELMKESILKFPNYFHFVEQYADIETDDLIEWVNETVSKNNLFSVFAVGSGIHVDHALKNLLHFHEVNGGIPIVIPLEKRRRDIEPILIEMYKEKKIILALEDIKINRNLLIKIQNRNTKSMDPFSGVGHSNEGVSFLVGDRTLSFQSRPTKKRGHPVANISSGILSYPNYPASINHNLNGRTAGSTRAEDTHFFGFTLIEKVDNRIFIPTQVEYDMIDKSFSAYFVKYKNGKMSIDIPTDYAGGDIHENERSRQLTGHFMSIGKKLKIENFYAHDVFNCASVSHWGYKNKMERIYNNLTGQSSLAEELKTFASFMEALSECFKKVNVVASNHDDMLIRQFNDGQIFKDHHGHNSFLAYLLSPYAILDYHEKESNPIDFLGDQIEGIDKKFLREMFPFLMDDSPILAKAMKLFGASHVKNINWYKIDDSDTSNGYEMLEHGNVASNGARGNMKSFLKDFYAIIFGHTHQAMRKNRHIGLGHNIDMRKGHRPLYPIAGTSSWTVADAVVYKNKTAHHLFCIDGVKSRFMSDAWINPISKGLISIPTEKEKMNPKYPDLFEVLDKSISLTVEMVS